ncbi:PucR family transcriptional regulator [Paenarthrobacter sp. NPDC090522]|uniref:PucR family transcriptional regulator n=1 Tax=Paenarthrobacter sp. NPDC090522 TaxID=3364383 RepID=UPI00382BD041
MEQSALTVRDLVTSRSLGTKVLAGENGLDRQVLWAHSCELNDPERWLGPHELLMTVGLCVPRTPEKQRAFIAKLDQAGLAGVALGDHPTLPSVTTDLLDEANARSFPVLLTNAETPFAAIGRTVAAATATTQTLQVLKLSKLYQVSANARTDPVRVIEELQTLLHVGLSVRDTQTGLTILAGSQLLKDSSPTRERSYPLPGEAEARLVFVEYPGEEVSSFFLMHILQVVDVAVNQHLRAVRRRSERASQTLATILDGEIPSASEVLLKPESIAKGFQMVTIAPEDGPKVARAIAIEALPVLAGLWRGSYFALTPLKSREDVRRLLQHLKVRAAASSTHSDLRDARMAAAEAADVYTSSGTSSIWTDFEGVPVTLLTRSRKEANTIIRQVLGELAQLDPKSSVLRETLFAFIAHDRHWNETAASLGIHRQSLAYRLNRIKEITGRDVASSADLSAFWLAYQAWTSYSPS